MVKTDTEMDSSVRSGGSKVAAEIWDARVMHEAPYWTPRVRRLDRTAAFTVVVQTVSRRRGEMVRSRRPANEDLNQKIKIEPIILDGPLL
jgi:hypothetical protein